MALLVLCIFKHVLSLMCLLETLLIVMQRLSSSSLQHDTLEVLVLTDCWAGEGTIAFRYTPLATHVPHVQVCAYHVASGAVNLGQVRRCSRLRTLVVVQHEPGFFYAPDDINFVPAPHLPALVLDAPTLRALQLVLHMVSGVAGNMAGVGLGPLLSSLEALPNLASLALGWAFMVRERSEQTTLVGERIADVLDAMQVSLSG